MRRRRWILLAPVAILLFVALGGFVVQWLWNWLLPAIFGWPRVSFWQAVGLLALCRILFGGLGHRGMGHSHMRRHLRERWERMTPEERERFRRGLHDRCCGPRASAQDRSGGQ